MSDINVRALYTLMLEQYNILFNIVIIFFFQKFIKLLSLKPSQTKSNNSLP